ncbi:MAG: DNA mismatch endonuclease Vsr [Acidimicrobiaceae bacterium]|nr:DNA mismatch endonuclease Vsr [Acidimicrobiaceae bacterium]
MRRPAPSSSQASLRMRNTPRRDTPGELALRCRLHALGFRYRVDASPLPETRRRADLVFCGARVAVYVDGCFWHGCPEHGTWPKANAEWWRQKIERNRVRDHETDDALTAMGWRSVRIWEHETLDQALDKVLRALRERGTPAAGSRR